ncbi:MAG: transglycosylase SLT domain-containing protein [Myxococcota bacterium]
MRTLIFAVALLASPSASATTLDEVHDWMRAGRGEAVVAALTTLLPTLDEAAQHDARFTIGRLLVEEGRPQALEYLTQLPAPFDPVDDRRLFWLARAYALNPTDPAALAAIDAALRATKDDREVATLTLARADVLDAQSQPAAAEKALARVAARPPRDLAAHALRRLALRARDRTPKPDLAAAKRYARRIAVRFPDTDASPTADLGLQTSDLSDRERFDRAKILMAHFRYVEAREELRRLTEHPKLGYEARWLVGVIGLQKLRDAPVEARAMLERVAASPGPRAEDALMGVMRTWIKEDHYEDALKVGDSYLRRYPKGAHRAAIAYYKGWLPYDQRNCKEAVPALRSYMKSYGDKGSYVRGFIAWCGIRDGQWEQAIRDYDVLVSYGGAVTRGKAWYWQGVALDELGRRDEARERFAKIRRDYPLTWYDILAQQRIARWDGRDPRASALPWPEGGTLALAAHPVSRDALEWPRLSGRNAAAFARVKRLVALGEVDHARAAYGSIRTGVERSVPSDQRDAFIRAMADAVEDYKHGWDLASGGRLGGMWALDEPESARWLMGYPRAYKPLVEYLGGVDGVPPAFIYSIMRQESRYHPAMVSAMDAVGALQMIFPTAEQVAVERGLTFDAVSFADPRVGFAYSSHYMARHDTIWHGQLVLTAASYNAGPQPIARWLRENKGAPLDRLVEEFTYNEARAYCRMVASHLLRYLWLYEADPAKRAPILDRLFPLEVNYEVPDDVGY